jgi:hypothetical protein
MTIVLWPIAGGFVLMSVRARRNSVAEAAWDLAAAVSYTALIPLNALTGDWPGAVLAAFLAVFAWVVWWVDRHGRRKRRSLKALGSKARARLASMLRNMPRPGPVLRPVPQGV